MSTETFNPRNVELPSHWDTVKHFGGRVLRLVLGIQNPAQDRALPSRVVSGASGGLVHSIVETPSIKESETASSWQRVRNYPGYTVPGPVSRVEAPQVANSYLMGVRKEQTQTEPQIKMVQGGLVIGAKEAPARLQTAGVPQQVHAAGRVIGQSPEGASQVSEVPQNNDAGPHGEETQE
ncbi:MAG TPA: hypothetical protein VFT87_04655 [Candidatus Saccharimonadales bacterium]|nr:hypothetical protein [Candidatus Saccharimonadales bacterium]